METNLNKISRTGEFQGALVISLDFELLWGVFDKIDFNHKKEYFLNTRNIIPKILDLFAAYEIHATWATVGMLFNKDWNEWEVNKPELLPSYNNERLNAYRYGEGIKDFNTDAYCFAQSLIQKIDRSPGQEIGTHTYSHYYCKEAGQSKDMFRADLVRAIKLAEKLGVKLRSIVFPRNQFKEEYIQICMDLGIDSFRSNPDSWYWKNPESNSILHKIFRTGEAYLGNNDKSYSLISTKSGNGKTFQKASRMFRPPSVYNKLEKLKISRIKSEIEKAAKNSEIYHLWWHPHNFGDNPSLCLNQLTEILESYSDAKKKYGFESLSMSEITDLANYN